MTATYSCNMCQNPVAPDDHQEFSRKLNLFEVCSYVYADDAAPRTSSGTHLCVPCICKVLTDGKRARTVGSDEIPF